LLAFGTPAETTEEEKTRVSINSKSKVLKSSAI
jgi:hypothetical protein